LALGESIAVNGVCLTVEGFVPGGFSADLSVETHNRTTLGGLLPGAQVNLERALAVGDRLGGHFVSGHVDGLCQVIETRAVGQDLCLRLRAPQPLMHLIAVKGSVCINGVSLTVNSIRANTFELLLVPHTLKATTLGAAGAGSELNLEVDVLARYVERCLSSSP
jgi:riboflavin synthase